MPTTILRNALSPTGSTSQKTETFTGTVYMDPIIAQPSQSASSPAINSNNVFFTPCARTYWHTHEHGQLLHVTAGSGWVCEKGSAPQRIAAGDVVWCPAGTTHWHGADKGHFLGHLAVSLGKTSWDIEVTEEEYAAGEK